MIKQVVKQRLKKGETVEISCSQINDKNEIVEYIAKKIVVKHGKGAYISLPRELIGKYVAITLIKEVKE